ncbi:MAG TPA: hypothetical protein PL033_07040 [Candidatus Brocadiia bacterium]|nr:hypothetical protein [Candidatus Brocadiia bacterium]
MAQDGGGKRPSGGGTGAKVFEDVVIVLTAFALGITLLYPRQPWTRQVWYVLLALMVMVSFFRVARLLKSREENPGEEMEDTIEV